MPVLCNKCKRELSTTAKFCKFCGSAIAAIPVGSPAPGGGVAVQAAAPVREAVRDDAYCRECGEPNANTARFCRKCGKPLAASSPAPVREQRPMPPVREARPLPPREVPVRIPDLSQVMNRINSSGSKLAAAGAALAFIGCFLPLASAMGEHVTVIQGITEQDGSFLLILPLSAVALAIMASTGGDSRLNRTLLGGGVIALSSPWAVLWLLLLLGGKRLISSLGMFSFGAEIGIGMFALAIGFTVTLVGGFVILYQAAKSSSA